MGHTHYWQVKEPDGDALAALIADTAKIIAASKVEMRSGDATGDPEVGPDRIWLNGAEALEEDYEPFGFTGHGRHFCKTGRRPYDEVVCAVLIRAKLHYGDKIDVESDGPWHPDWDAGARLCEQAFGGEPTNPLRQD